MTQQDDLREGLIKLAEKLETLTEELRKSHMQLLTTTQVQGARMGEHERLFSRVFNDIDELDKEVRELTVKLSSWEQRGTKWGEQLDMSVKDLQDAVRDKITNTSSRRTAYIVTGVTILVTIILTLFSYIGIT